VKRVDALNDRRTYLIYLTEEGRHAVEVCNPLVQQVKEKITEVLTEDEIRSLRRMLDIISRNLD